VSIGATGPDPIVNSTVTPTTSNPYTGHTGSGYSYYKFNSSGTLTITLETIVINYIIVGGGGNGSTGSNSAPLGGGGGSGGEVITGSVAVLPGTYSITVGGAGSTSSFHGYNARGGTHGSFTSAGGVNSWGYGNGGTGGFFMSGATGSTGVTGTNGISGLAVSFVDGSSSSTRFGGGGGGGGVKGGSTIYYPPGSGGTGGGGAGGSTGTVGGHTGSGVPGTAHTGGGGGGTLGPTTINMVGGIGGTGVVLLYFLTPIPPVLYVDGDSYLNGDVFIQQANYNQLTMSPIQLGYTLYTPAPGAVQLTSSIGIPQIIFTFTIPSKGVWLIVAEHNWLVTGSTNPISNRTFMISEETAQPFYPISNGLYYSDIFAYTPNSIQAVQQVLSMSGICITTGSKTLRCVASSNYTSPSVVSVRAFITKARIG
jgi:hypothetical protein